MSLQNSDRIENFAAPITVFMNLTQQCNLHCVYCSAEVVPPRRGRNGELTDEEMLDLVGQLVAARVFRYALTGGEVFLRRKLLFEILDRVTTVGSVTVLSNATMIRDEDARRLSGYGKSLKVELSIDSSAEEINALTRGRHVLGRTLRGARRLMEHGIRPTVNCVVSRWNYEGVPALVEFLKENGFPRLQILPLRPWGYAKRLTDRILSPSERREFTRRMVELAERESTFEVIPGDDNPWMALEEACARCEQRGKSEGKPKMLLPCSAAVDQCSITADGWVIPCNSMPSYRCGNVRDKEFLAIWRDSLRLQAVRELRQTPVTDVAECSRCRYQTVCRGGCRAIAFETTGDLLGLDSNCPYYHSSSPELVPITAAAG